MSHLTQRPNISLFSAKKKNKEKKKNISLFCFSFSFFSSVCKIHPRHLPRKSRMIFVACSTASFNEVSYRMWARLQSCHAPNIVNRHII